MSSKMLVAVLAATTILAGSAAFADQQTSAQSSMTPPPGHAAMLKDFNKLSADGARAYQDLTLARLAIFDGRAADAKKYVDDADTGFNKAKTDESVFTQAEATMRTHMAQNNGSSDSNDKTADSSTGAKSSDAKSSDAKTGDASNGSASNGNDVNKPVAWLPVDGAISINEDFTAKPEKAKAVQDANQSLAQGDKKGAMEKLKLADVDTTVTIAVVPLQQTIEDVDQAKQLIESGKYYEGSQKLRAVQNATVITVADTVGTPSKGQGGAPKGASDTATH